MFYEKLSNLNQKNYNSNIDLSKVALEDGSSISLNIGQNYYLKGTTGAGKTTVALQLAKHFIQKMTEYVDETAANQSVEFIKYNELIELFKTFNDEAKARVKKLKTIKFLIIDDLGSGYGKEHSLIQLEDFIDDRMGLDNLGVTIFTTNINFKSPKNSDLAESFSRVLSRIGSMCTIKNMLELKNRDLRVETSQVQTFNFSKYEVQKTIELVQNEGQPEEDFLALVNEEKEKGHKVNLIFNEETKEKKRVERLKVIEEVKKTLVEKKMLAS